LDGEYFMPSRGAPLTRQTLGTWLREQMRRRQWKQADLAREMGVSTGRVSEWVNGKQVPRTDSIDKIADVFGADVDLLLTLAGHRPATDPIDPNDPIERICGMVRRLKPDAGQVETLEVLLATWLRQKRDARKGQGRVPDSDAVFGTNFVAPKTRDGRRRSSIRPSLPWSAAGAHLPRVPGEASSVVTGAGLEPATFGL
jgi:transcriptional regulator with XRE-family HTH domain